MKPRRHARFRGRMFKLTTRDQRVYCTAVSCKRCSNVDLVHGAVWCVEHAAVVRALRVAIQPHALTPQEIWSRLQELCLRKWSDDAHQVLVQRFEPWFHTLFPIRWVHTNEFERALGSSAIVLLLEAVWFYPKHGKRMNAARARKRLAAKRRLHSIKTMHEYMQLVSET